jgi:competence protein ComGC
MKAWTLIGMLCILAVLGTLAAIVIPWLSKKGIDSPMGKVVAGEVGIVCLRGSLFTLTAEGVVDQPLLDAELKVMKC